MDRCNKRSSEHPLDEMNDETALKIFLDILMKYSPYL